MYYMYITRFNPFLIIISCTHTIDIINCVNYKVKMVYFEKSLFHILTFDLFLFHIACWLLYFTECLKTCATSCDNFRILVQSCHNVDTT